LTYGIDSVHSAQRLDEGSPCRACACHLSLLACEGAVLSAPRHRVDGTAAVEEESPAYDPPSHRRGLWSAPSLEALTLTPPTGGQTRRSSIGVELESLYRRWQLEVD